MVQGNIAYIMVRNFNELLLNLKRYCICFKRLFSLVPIFIFPLCAFCQNLHFKHYTVEDGLSYYRIPRASNLLQDEQGFLWIPTFNGLNRFDGREFRVFKNDPNNPNSIDNNVVLRICQDTEGKIWASIDGSREVNIYDPQTGIFEKLQDDSNFLANAPGQRINTMAKDKDGNMWLSSSSHIYKCQKGSRVAELYRLKNSATGNTFLQTKDGKIWIGSNDGLYMLLPEQDSFVHYILDSNHIGNRKYNGVKSMIEDENGEIWVTSREIGCAIFNPANQSFRPFPKNLLLQPNQAPVTLLNDTKGNIWLGDRGVVIQYQPAQGTVKIHRNQKEDFTTWLPGWGLHLLSDAAGSLWVASGMRGIGVAHTIQNPFYVLPENTYKENIIALDDRHVLLPTQKGILKFDIYQQKIVPSDFPTIVQNANAQWMRFSKQGDLWWWDKGQKKTFSYSFQSGKTRTVKMIERFAIDSNGNVWFKKKFFYYDIRQEKLIDLRPLLSFSAPDSLVENCHISWIAVDTKDRVWYGTNGAGLLMLDAARKELKIFRHNPFNANSLSNGAVNRVLAASNGWIYCRTNTALNVYQPERDTFIHFTEKDGMPGTQYMASIEDNDGNMWFATTRGLTKLNIQDWRFSNFDFNDGLPGGVFNWGTGKDALGYLYFKKNGQLIRFHPDSIQQKDFTTPIVFTDFFLNQKKIEIGEHDSLLRKNIHYQHALALDYTQSDFGFRFVSPNFYKPEKIQYYYKLENYDSDWIGIGNKLEVHFTNIPAGKYRFKVKAKTEADFWTKEEKSILITVFPPWWKTKWAYGSYCLLLIGLLWLIRKYELSRIYSKNEAKRLSTMDALKTKLYTNITHEFRTPLTVILGMAEQMKAEPEARKLIRRNSKNLLHLVNQLLDMSKLESGKMSIKYINGNIVSYIKYLVASFQSFAAQKNIALSFSADIEKWVMPYDPEKIQHILANLLSNAIKFTEQEGEVHVHVSKHPANISTGQDQKVEIRVKDNGIGIRESDLPHIFDRFHQVDDSLTRRAQGTGIGLALAKELVNVMGGEISVKSEFGKGSELIIVLPVRQMSSASEKRAVQEITHGNVENDILDLEELLPEIAIRHSDTTDELADTELPLLLIIEDNADVVFYIKDCVKTYFRTKVAPDGQKGIDAATELIPDVIICDVMMPEKDGFEVTQFLKHDERTSHIPIVMLTAKVDTESKITGLTRGADAYLTKPFHKEELLIRLQKLVELRQRLQSRYATPGLLPLANDAALQIEDAFLRKVQQVVEAHLDDADFRVAGLCKALAISQPQLYRKIKALTGKSISVYIRSIRLHKAKSLLMTTDMNVSEVAYHVGFTSPAYFSKMFVQEFNYSPSERR